jgi:hypothetical protein
VTAGEREPFQRLSADMFLAPRRLRPVAPVLRRLPLRATEGLLAALSVGDGLFRRSRFRDALQWAAFRRAGPWGRRSLALALLANHGRFVASELLLDDERARKLRARTRLIGKDHLPPGPEGALLLGFHLGPPRTWLLLRAFGYPVRFAGSLQGASGNSRWTAAVDAGEVIPLLGGPPERRMNALHLARGLLRDGGWICMTADGPLGREAFRIELAGAPLIVRTGWLALRRVARVPTLPVLSYESGGERVLHVHPPLPQVDDDLAADTEACRRALTPILEDYVQRFPAQCRWLAIPRN